MYDFGKYLDRCDQLAKEAALAGNSAVGSVIVKGGEIVAEGIESTVTHQDITSHAEIEAIRKARALLGKDLSDCLLVSTHEPCVMCGYAIRYHKIKAVAFRSPADYLGSITSSMQVLTTQEVPEHWSQPPEIIYLNS